MLRRLPLVALFLFGCSQDTSPIDASQGGDTGLVDSGNAAADAGPIADAGLIDSGPGDAGTTDAQPTDTGSPDAGPVVRDRWEDAAPVIGGALQETAVVAMSGEVVMVGGYNAAAQFGTRIEAYNPATDTWRQLEDLPTAMHHANAAVVDGKLYVLGYLAGGFAEFGDCYVFDPANNTWSPIATMTASRERGSSVVSVHDGKIYVAGGFANGVAVPLFDVYDPVQDSWSPLPPIPRVMDHGAGGIIDGKLYVAGGREGGINSHRSQLDIYDIATGMWSQGADMPTSRGGNAGAVLNGRLFVFGGEGNPNDPSQVFDEVEAYDPVSNTWEVLAPMVPGRHGTGAATIGDRIYVPGGADVIAFGAVATHQVYLP